MIRLLGLGLGALLVPTTYVSLSLADHASAEQPRGKWNILIEQPPAIGDGALRLFRSARGIDRVDPWQASSRRIEARALGGPPTPSDLETDVPPAPNRSDAFHRWRPVDADDPWAASAERGQGRASETNAAPGNREPSILAGRAGAAAGNW